MSKKPKGLEHTYQVRLYPTPEQGRLLMAHCQEYISTVNMLASAMDADVSHLMRASRPKTLWLTFLRA
ncbi:MAG: hypothetical protein ACJ8BW_03450 [Ktedonobacteraceae bacterium]